MFFLRQLFGTRNERYIKSIRPVVERINALEPKFTALSDDEMGGLTAAFRERYAAGESVDALLPEAFAAVREAARRVLGERHYDVQLMGGIILHQGKIPEMKTGEGKTLVATLAAYLNAIPGKGVHIVTVNDYLAKRDSEWMGRVFRFLGMTCSAITNDLSKDERREAYAADIAYATNNELGFDYLRDNMVYRQELAVQRPLHYAIVDEVDSILIDEARTPLIISGPTEDKTDLYRAMNEVMPYLHAKTHYEVDEKMKAVSLTDEGMDKAEEVLREKGMLGEGDSLYEMSNVMLVHHLNQALRAHTLFQKDVDYIIHNNQVVIIDEFTGRMMQGRRFSEGLHQALEAKENAEIQSENQTLASVTFQNFFRMYEKLAGMTGTADTEAEEFESIYNLQVVVVPTHIGVQRKDEADRIYRTRQEKMNALLADIEDCASRGQPILVGTASIEHSEEVSELLKEKGITHQVLNARHHEREAEIIAQAGRKGAITIATNMAGRGTDIKLGGSLELLLKEAGDDETAKQKIIESHAAEKAEMLALGGLRVVGTERHESRRIDNQLRGRSGRQGDPGSSAFYISLQDDLMRIFAKGLDTMMERLDMPEGEVIQSRLVSTAIETAQRKLESRNFEIRKNLLKYDDVLNDQRKVVYEQRKEVLTSGTVDDIITEFRAEAAENLFARCFPDGSYEEAWLFDTFHEEMLRIFGLTVNAQAWMKEEQLGLDEVKVRALTLIRQTAEEKEARIGANTMRHLEKALMMQVMDYEWRNHLQRLDALRQGIHLRGYGQKDPLNEFKREAFMMFEALLNNVRDNVLGLLARVEVGEGESTAFLADDTEDDQRLTAAMHAEHEEVPAFGLPHEAEAEQAARKSGVQSQGAPNNVINIDPLYPRNAACPCGSGRKFKHCHGVL